MCITFLYINPVPNEGPWQLILLNSREEFFDRPTESAQWKDGILCGRDMFPGKEGGTWLGVNEAGKIGVVMNILEKQDASALSKTSRGTLVINYLKGTDDERFIADMKSNATNFQGFSIILLTKNESSGEWNVKYFCNRSDDVVEELKPGIYGFGNSPRKTPFRKVQAAADTFKNIVDATAAWKTADSLTLELVRVLQNDTMYYPDEQLRSQCYFFSESVIQGLSKCFVDLRPQINFGSRTHTVLLVDHDSNITFTAFNRPDDDTPAWTRKCFNFKPKH